MISRIPPGQLAAPPADEEGLPRGALDISAAPSGEVRGAKILLQRVEFKYLVDRSTRTALTRDLKALMRSDSYAESDGTYLVRSLYFDTPHHRAFQEKSDGLAVRHKLRVRAYGADPSQTALVRLEVKTRYLSLIHKTVIDVPREKYAELEQCFQRRILPPDWLLQEPGVSLEFFRIQRQYCEEPKVLLQYRREAFERREIGRIRVNFDDDLRATTHLHLLAPLVAARPVLRYGHSVFEIKVDGPMPSWLHMLIGKYGLSNQAFSKYCYGMRAVARLSTMGRESKAVEESVES